MKFHEKTDDTAAVITTFPHHNMDKLMSAFTTTAAVYTFTSLIISRVQSRNNEPKEKKKNSYQLVDIYSVRIRYPPCSKLSYAISDIAPYF
jgi:hypothetical protein